VFEESSPPRPMGLSTRVTALAFGILAAFVTLGGLLQMLNLAWGLWCSELFVFLGLTWISVSRWGVDPARLSGLDAVTPRGLGFGLAAGALNYLAWAVPLMALAQAVFPRRVVELFDSSTIFKHQGPVETVLLVAGVGLAAPVCEELFFRGALQQGLMTKLPPPTAIVVSALVFAAFHLDPVGFLARFELGVVFGLLAWRGGSVWPAVAAHAANNLLSSAIFFAAGQDAEGELAWWVPTLTLLVGNAGLAALVRWGGRALENPRPAAVTPAPPRSLVRLVSPWLTAGALALGGLLLVDPRGVQLGLIDGKHPLGRDARKDEQLWKLRDQARRGEVGLDEYEAYRASLGGTELPRSPALAPDGGAGALK